MKLVYAGTSTQYLVDVSAIKFNVVQVLGNLPMKEKGFKLIDDEGAEYDYSAFKTLYREVDGGYQYSNDGEVWTEPTRNVTVEVEWKDDNDEEQLRPKSVSVTVIDGDTALEKITLNADDSWSKTYEDVPESHVYSIKASDVANYSLEVNGTIATYTFQKPLKPSVEEMIAELTDMVINLDERVHALEEGK